MKNYIKVHPWKIEEEGFDPSLNEISESIFSIGNGAMGQRANFEEHYSGKSLEGCYIGGVYYPDKTRVGWWKNGYPEYFAKVLNAPKWIGLNIKIDGKLLDLNTVQEILSFRRILDMKQGLLQRSFIVKISDNVEIKVQTERFVSMDDNELGCMSYSISSNTPVRLDVESYLNTDVVNQDSNYDEKFWNPCPSSASSNMMIVEANTKKTDYKVVCAAETLLWVDGKQMVCEDFGNDEHKAYQSFTLQLSDSPVKIEKKSIVLSSINYKKSEIRQSAIRKLQAVLGNAYDEHKVAHQKVWENLWQSCDIEIEGDVSAQQGIRFNIFQLLQTYTGKDARLNIGPKGFTGEKYGGVTYWDTEAYCLPFYMFAVGDDVARNLLVYRHNHLQKAIENAEKLGFKDGAALYPMVTMNGEECHNEWEITFEEIHRNGAIAYAIYDYVKTSGDENYLQSHGLEVLIGICRFWAQRVNWSENKKAYVMLGVTGPNEYENNVNNNWYTNFIAKWCLNYTKLLIEQATGAPNEAWNEICLKTNFRLTELEKWQNIADLIFLPFDSNRGVFLQQDGFLDKELIAAEEIPNAERPINQHWSWDRILRSCFIKQADVLQGLYFFEEQFNFDTIEKNFDFYEPMTVHESSLSPCVHVILASKLGRMEKAYELYQRTARLDLNDYNNDTQDGLHITSMAGTWMSIVKGFGGMRIIEGQLHIRPSLPPKWKSFSFKIKFRSNTVAIRISTNDVKISNLAGNNLKIWLNNHKFEVLEGSAVISEYSQYSTIKSSAI